MKCHWCGDLLGITAAAFGEGDFCSGDHRKRFELRLAKGVALLAKEIRNPQKLGVAIDLFTAAEFPRGPVRLLEPMIPLRLPVAALTIALDPNLVPEAACEDARSTDAVTNGAETSAGADPEAKSDRIASLRLRLGSLHKQLNRASGGQKRLATA